MKFLAEADALTIKLEGVEMLFGLARKLTLPRENIVNLVWLPEYNFDDLLLRIGGASIPQLLFAGRFRDLTTKQNIFLYLNHARGLGITRTLSASNVLCITTQGYTYTEIYVNCEPDIGASLMNWFKGVA